MEKNTETQPEVLPLDELPLAKSDQMIGWLHGALSGGRVIDAAEWNKAVTALKGTSK